MTVFQCFTDGCTDPDGNPLMWHLWDAHGAFMIIIVVVIYIFVTFGVFNMIVAIFVENTMACAHATEQKRLSNRAEENRRHARKLRTLLVRFFTTADETGQNALVKR